MEPAFRYYALAATVVALHLVLLSNYTGFTRLRRKQFINPEDAARFTKGPPAADDHPDVLRVKRAHQNLVENAIPFFVVGALYAATGATATGAKAYFGVFVAARVLHTVAYLAGKQPWRTLAFGVGLLAIAGMAAHVIRTVV